MDAALDPIDSTLLENKLCSLLIARVRDYAIFMLNPHGEVMTWNDGARLIKGYTRDEIIGKPMSRFYSPRTSNTAGRPSCCAKRRSKDASKMKVGASGKTDRASGR